MTRAEIKTNLHTLHTTRVVTDIHGNTHPTRPLIQQIQEIDGETRPYTPGTPSFKSRPPGRLDVMDWIRTLNATLYSLAGVKPPAGVSLMAWCETVANNTLEHLGDSAIIEHTATTARLVAEAHKLAYTELFRVRAQCPACGEEETHATTDDGHHKTGETLVVYELWAECDTCHHRWDGAAIMELAKHIARDEETRRRLLSG